MEGLYCGHGRADDSRSKLNMLIRRPDLEVMTQLLASGDSIAWITPAEDPEAIEFFFVLEGTLELIPEGNRIRMETGEYFYVTGLKRDVGLQAIGSAKLLYITNRPVFDALSDFSGNLDALVRLVDEKDNYTYLHCRNVMRYSVKLARMLCPEGFSMDDLVAASLFHDVGKSRVPDGILKKPGKLTPDEFREMMKHPKRSAKLILPRFGERAANIALDHHERLDGSGYPSGKQGREISFESRIIAVADSFDAMTTFRPYISNPKSFSEAASELLSLPKLYDISVAAALADSVADGSLFPKDRLEPSRGR